MVQIPPPPNQASAQPQRRRTIVPFPPPVTQSCMFQNTTITIRRYVTYESSLKLALDSVLLLVRLSRPLVLAPTIHSRTGFSCAECRIRVVNGFSLVRPVTFLNPTFIPCSTSLLSSSLLPIHCPVTISIPPTPSHSRKLPTRSY
jgi:hypothetical protein